MLKRLHLMIIRMLPGPFFGWLALIMFLLLMQFLMKYLPDIAGKGLPFLVIVELVVYNLAYMLVLAVPMAVLISSVMAFGRVTETRAYAVMKSAGVSFIRVAWPTLVLGLFLTGGMMYFNHIVLPEANFRARNLWQDIRKMKPAFDLNAGAFYQGLNRYSILVQQLDPETDTMHDITIYDYTASNRSQTVIKASQGRVISQDSQPYVDLFLENGEVHTVADAVGASNERYERLAFEQYRFRLDLSDFVFERSDPTQGFRSDRTMRTDEMTLLLDSLATSTRINRERLTAPELALATAAELESPDHDDAMMRLAAADPSEAQVQHPEMRFDVVDEALKTARERRTSIDDARRTISWEEQRANRYRVEIHKKYSIAVACFIFALVGAPIGVGLRRGGLGLPGAAATAIFLFYWVTLVQGEKFSDRGLIEPWVGMWGANLVILIIGITAFIYVGFDLRGTPRLLTRLRRRLNKNHDALPGTNADRQP